MKKLTKESLDKLEATMPVISEGEQKNFIGGAGESGGPGFFDFYSYDEAMNLIGTSDWHGGHVEGLGYVAPTVCVFAGEGDYYTFEELMNKLSPDLFERVTGTFLDFITLGVTGFYGSELDRMYADINNVLLENGYQSDSVLYQKRINLGDHVQFDIYDGSTGQLVVTKTIHISGYW